MQHSLRDPNRDVEHGRIWRITYTNRPLVEKPKIAGATVPELLDLLKVVRGPDPLPGPPRASRAHRPTRSSRPLEKWVAGLEQERPGLLAAHARSPLAATEPRRGGRGAPEGRCSPAPSPRPAPRPPASSATGATAWRSRSSCSAEQVNDEHPRVRLEAVRALSFFDGKDAAKAQEIALESLRPSPGLLPRIHAERDQQDARPADQESK